MQKKERIYSNSEVISTTNNGNNEIVKTAVSEYESLLNYEPETNEVTMVVTSESCSEEDLIVLLSFIDNFFITLMGI